MPLKKAKSKKAMSKKMGKDNKKNKKPSRVGKAKHKKVN